MNRRVLITGVGGFIGSHLAEHVVRLGALTRCFLRYTSQGSLGWLAGSPLRSELEIIHGDVRDYDSVVRASGHRYHLSSRRIGRNSLFVSFTTIVCSDQHRGNPECSRGNETAWSRTADMHINKRSL